MENKQVIGVVQVLQHLKDGMTRDDIASHYGITKSECKLLFQDPRLKGKKTIKKPTFVLVEDATEEIEVKDAQTVGPGPDATNEVAEEEEQENVETQEEEGGEETSPDPQEDIETPQQKASWGDD